MRQLSISPHSRASVNPELQEAAIIDGASRVQRIWNVDLPAIRPTIVMMLIFNVGQIMNIGFEKAYLMKNSVNQANAEIISTFVYEIGLKNGDFSFSTAVGLFNSVISLLLFVFVNEISKRLTETSVWEEEKRCLLPERKRCRKARRIKSSCFLSIC